MTNQENQQIVVYKSKDGQITFSVNVQKETVWLSQDQMSKLFDTDRTVVTKHITNIFKEGELIKESNVQKMHFSHSDKPITMYSLDIIISVGYRVKSKRSTQFRIWASKIIKEYLLKGYSINENRLKTQTKKIKELELAVKVLSNVLENKALTQPEAVGLLKVITDYTYALDLLDQYDHQQLEVKDTNTQEIFKITYKEAIEAIKQLEKQFSKHGESTTLFGKELYPSIEEKAAHLLYFVIKNHSFTDGNKRIGAFLFIWFLERNKYLYAPGGNKRIEDNALVARA